MKSSKIVLVGLFTSFVVTTAGAQSCYQLSGAEYQTCKLREENNARERQTNNREAQAKADADYKNLNERFAKWQKDMKERDMAKQAPRQPAVVNFLPMPVITKEAEKYYQAGLHAYRANNWIIAESNFEKVAAISEDPRAQGYLSYLYLKKNLLGTLKGNKGMSAAFNAARYGNLIGLYFLGSAHILGEGGYIKNIEYGKQLISLAVTSPKLELIDIDEIIRKDAAMAIDLTS